MGNADSRKIQTFIVIGSFRNTSDIGGLNWRIGV